MADTTLQFILEAQDKASQTIKQVEKNISGFSGTVDSLQPAFKKMASAGGIAFAGIGAAIYTAISAAKESAGVHAQLNEVLNSTKGVAGVTAEAALNLADSLKKVTTYDDDAILSGENMLLTFTNIGKDIFPQTTRATLDMASAMGMDLKSSAIQLGKALNDPTQGISALTRNGVTFTEQQKDQIKALQESGHLLEAQKIVLAEVNKEFGNSANINDFGDRLTKLGQSIDDAKKALGFALEPALNSILEKMQPVINKLIDWTNAHPQLATAIVLVSGALAGLVTVVGLIGLALPTIIAIVTTLTPAFVMLAGPIGLVALAIGALVAVVIYYRDEVGQVLTQIDQQTGLLSSLKTAWDNIVTTFTTTLMPALKQLWEAITPLKPFFEVLIQIVGVLLVAALTMLALQLKVVVQVFTFLIEEGIKVVAFLTNSFNGALNSVISTVQSAIGYVENLINAISRLNIMQAARQFVGTAVQAVSNVVRVNDAVISPSGQVVSTSPDDWLIATKTPGQLGGGGGITVNIMGGNYLSQDAAQMLGDKLIEQLRLNMRF